MKRILLSVATVILLATAANATSTEPVFWDDQTDRFYYKDGNKKVYLPGATDGMDGVDGEHGTDGADGTDGVDGKDGLDGADGTDGTDGRDGTDGTAGLDGEDGKDGTDGRDGTDGVDGTDGTAGVDGRHGQDGKDADVGQMAADRAVGSLQTRTPTANQWTGAFGLSGTQDGVDGVTGGVRYGISDQADLYLVVGQSFDGDTSWGAGATFVLGGGN